MYIHFHPAVVVRAATLACATAIAPLAMAADSAPSTARLLSGVPLPPEVQSENGIEYLTGGVSIDGRAQLPPLVRDMNLQLVFAEKQTGAYLAAVDVRIADARGEEVLKVSESDPMVFADLEPGVYQITARSSQGTLDRKVTVPEQGRTTEVFLWG